LGDLLVSLLREPSAPVAPLACTLAQGLGFRLGDLLQKVQRNHLGDLDVIGGLLSPACYIDQSFPAVLYLAARYADDFEAALVANTNVGGDNCHRGAVLGAILGAALGYAAIPERWIQGLTARAELVVEIETFIARLECREGPRL
jgi:ADP-ribosylglycohydrolase